MKVGINNKKHSSLHILYSKASKKIPLKLFANVKLFFFLFQSLQEEVPIPGSDIKFSYLSSRTAGYKSVLRVTLTHSTIPFNLMKVHLMVAVEGRLFRKWFPAAPNLSYDFVWDKADVYSQKVYGLSEAFGKQ